MHIFWILAFMLSAAADPFVGVWKLDAEKSKFTIGDPGLLSGAIAIESVGGGLKSSASVTTEDGLANALTFTCSLDSTPCKITSSLPMWGSTRIDTVSLRRIDDRTIVATATYKGKEVYSDRRVVSADNESMTITRSGTTAGGKRYTSTIVLVRSRSN